MEWLFGKRITPEEMLRKNQRALNKAMRDLDRERMRMEQQEKKIIADIKKLAKDGQMDAVKIMAKDLVRTRRYVKKFMLMKANIQAVSLKIQTLRSQNTMAQAMKGVTRAMQNMNKLKFDLFLQNYNQRQLLFSIYRMFHWILPS
uniref:Charged multivesicular body protein 2a n=1 Tax=Apis cerana TaxID=7461 RepID=V9IEE6_APICE